MNRPYDTDDEGEVPAIEFDDEPPFDCHLDRFGYCGKVGSEECDECPYSILLSRPGSGNGYSVKSPDRASAFGFNHRFEVSQ